MDDMRRIGKKKIEINKRIEKKKELIMLKIEKKKVNEIGWERRGEDWKIVNIGKKKGEEKKKRIKGNEEEIDEEKYNKNIELFLMKNGVKRKKEWEKKREYN